VNRPTRAHPDAPLRVAWARGLQPNDAENGDLKSPLRPSIQNHKFKIAEMAVPREVRRILGVRPGDSLVFESDRRGVRVRPVRVEGRFGKYRGIGNPGIPSGRKAILRWVRELRGK